MEKNSRGSNVCVTGVGAGVKVWILFRSQIDQLLNFETLINAPTLLFSIPIPHPNVMMDCTGVVVKCIDIDLK